MLVKLKSFLYSFILPGLIIIGVTLSIFGFLHSRDGWIVISTIYSGIVVLGGVSFQLISQRNKRKSRAGKSEEK